MEDQQTPHLDELELEELVEQQSDYAPADVSEKSIRPSQPLNFGTYISVLVEDWSVQLAAISHLGQIRKVKEIEKVHVSSQQHDQKERLTIITKTISDFIRKHRGPFSVISMAISGRETVLRNFLMPALNKKDLGSAIEIEAKKLLPFPLEDCSYDFRPISEVKSGNRKLYNISLLAATRRLIKEKLEPLGEHRKSVEHIHHAPDLVGRLLPYIEGFEDFAGYTTLNIGQAQSEIAFYRGSSLEFYNVVNMGASMLGSNPDQINYAFLAESLTNEIQTAIDFYTGRFSRTISDRIFVYGDLAYSDDVLKNLISSSGYTFERFPIDKLNFISKGELNKFESNIRVCLPAFAAASCPAGMADVLPPDEKKAHSAHRLSNYARAALLTLFAILIASWGLLDKAVSIKQKELATLNKQIDDFTSSEAFKSYNLLKRQIAIDKTYLESAKETPTFLSLNLKELTLLTPKEIRLLNLLYRPNDPAENYVLEGNVKSAKVPPEIILAEFIENLSGSPFYKDVEIIRHVKRDYKNGFEIDFAIKCRGII